MAYVARRLMAAVLILFGISLVTFLLLYLLPADPARQIAGRSATAQTVASIRAQLGLDQPLPVQYGRYLGRLAQGDLGRSYLQRAEVSELIASRLPASLVLMAAGIAAELVIGLGMGIAAALQRGRPADQALMVTSFVFVSAPQFVVGILLLYVFAVRLGWFPIGGYGTPAHVVLPALTLGLIGAGLVRADHALVADRRARPGLRPHGAREGPGAVAGAVPPRAAERDPADHRHGRDRHRPLHERDRGGGERVRLAGRRPADLAGDPAGRHPDHHGGDAGLGGLHRRGQPPRRSGGAAHRPAHKVALTNNREKKMRKTLLALAAGVALAALSAGAWAQPLADAKQGGSMTVTYKDDVSTLDPAIGYDWQNWSMIKSLFDGLMDYEPGTTDARARPRRELRHLRRRHGLHLQAPRRASNSTTAASWSPRT